MYQVTVLPHGALTPSGKPALSPHNTDMEGSALVKIVFPFQLVSEFDSWLVDTLQPESVERPTKAIEEYNDPEGGFADSLDLIHVIYYCVVPNDKLEEVEKFADTYVDLRG